MEKLMMEWVNADLIIIFNIKIYFYLVKNGILPRTCLFCVSGVRGELGYLKLIPLTFIIH